MTPRPEPPRELAELYDRSYARLVSLVAVVGGSRSEAEDVVQDVFVRLIGCWPTVSSYDDPEAWLRKLALGLLSNRRRKVCSGARALLRLGPPADAPAPTVDAVDLRRRCGFCRSPSARCSYWCTSPASTSRSGRDRDVAAEPGERGARPRPA